MSTTPHLSGISAEDPYYLLVRCLDSAVDGQLRSLVHLSGGCKLDFQTYHFPYEVVCRLAGRQQRGERMAIADYSDTDADTAAASEAVAPERLCSYGKPLTGNAKQNHCSTKCRVVACRANSERIAKKRASESVTAMIIPATPLKRFVEPARRANGSLRDTFSDLPTPVLLCRASRDSEGFNRRQAARGRV
jgi:hypothetical protein